MNKSCEQLVMPAICLGYWIERIAFIPWKCWLFLLLIVHWPTAQISREHVNEIWVSQTYYLITLPNIVKKGYTGQLYDDTILVYL